MTQPPDPPFAPARRGPVLFRLYAAAFLVLEAPLLLMLALEIALVLAAWAIRAVVAVARRAFRR